MITCPNCQHRFPIDRAETVEHPWLILSQPFFVATNLRIITKDRIINLADIEDCFVKSRYTPTYITLRLTDWLFSLIALPALILHFVHFKVLAIILSILGLLGYFVLVGKYLLPILEYHYKTHTLYIKLKDGPILSIPVSDPYIAPSIMRWTRISEKASAHGVMAQPDPFYDLIIKPEVRNYKPEHPEDWE